MREAIIRSARQDDAVALCRHCYPESNPADVHEYLAWCLRQAQKGWIVRLVAEVDGQAVGNVQLTVWGQTGEIGSLVVAPPFRRRGLARRLLEGLIAAAKEQNLVALEIGVGVDQPAVLEFYRQLGFHQSSDAKKELPCSTSPRPIVTLSMPLWPAEQESFGRET